MKRIMKTMLALLLVACMLLGTVSALAAENQPATAAETAIKDKRASELYDDKYTDVTLEVSGIERGNIDVVFVLGGGMTANKETVNSALKVFDPLMKSGKSVVKVAFISLEKGQEIICELTTLNPDTYEEFITAQFNYMNTLPEGTTNLHSQLVEAKRMLDADTSVEPENKYVFVIATGRTYWFDNADGEQVTIVNKVKGTDNNTYYYWADYLWKSQRGRNTSLYMIPDRYNNSYEAFMADYEKWIAADGDKYAFNPHFDVNDNAAYANWYDKNNQDLRALGVAGSRYGLGIVNPAPTADNFENGVMDAIGSETHPEHALNYERAQYESINAYKALVNAGYNCFAICSESPNYQNGSEYIKGYAKYTGTSTAQVGHSFMNYLATLGGQTEAPAVWDYERDAEGNMISSKTVLQEDFFTTIEEKLTSTVAAGSYVVDYIGYNGDEENGYDFDFIQDAGKITLKVGEVAYTTAQVATKDGCTASYTFTAPGASKATFFLDYTYGNGTTEERFVWSFDEDVVQDAPASLKYTLELVNRSEIPGIHGGDADNMKVYTNQEALLYRKDSKYPEKFNEEEFPMPQVQYEVPGVDIKGSKIWDDDDNRDGVRPESITINLLADGVEVAEKIVTADDNWSWNFKNMRKTQNGEPIVYTVTEDAVDNYETEMSEPVVAENGDVTVTFTNSYTPETIEINGSKTWNDDADRDGVRPESITINLLADGVEIAEKVVTAADNWSWDFGNQPKYRDQGVEIVYTITEDEVNGYSATVDEYNVTNTHEIETVDIEGSKTWNDDADRDGVRPESITINLLADGVEIAEK
ncbi:MAG: Cna B-type domain-containing protein, partial [Oscillospiraceae bacterium]|nr:Cna B-type domain-containing protein [Oscillospiraceae bacterium]